jgi:hypothetical protein
MPEEAADIQVQADELPPPRALLAIGGIAGVALAGTIALWLHYGTAVFFETIRAGFMACFG